MLTQKRGTEKQLFACLKRAKGRPPEKSTTDEKERNAYSRPWVMMQKGRRKKLSQ
jgi:hypothetical protein